MSNIWFTSDTHFGHDRDFLWGPRGFSSIEEHDETIIENWNKMVKPEDTIYHLGDAMLGDNEHGIQCLTRLNGTIFLFTGNHDTSNRQKLYQSTKGKIMTLGYADLMKYGKWKFYLSHYPTMIGNFGESHPKFWCVCGHSHTQDRWKDFDNKCYHVELDAQNNKPISLEDLQKDIQEHIALL